MSTEMELPCELISGWYLDANKHNWMLVRVTEESLANLPLDKAIERGRRTYYNDLVALGKGLLRLAPLHDSRGTIEDIIEQQEALIDDIEERLTALFEE